MTPRSRAVNGQMAGPEQIQGCLRAPHPPSPGTVVIAIATLFRLTDAVDALEKQLAAVIRRDRLLPKGRPVLVAVSGGLDSMSLLHALAQLRRQFGWQLTAAHFNHRLRGRAADKDERLVLKVCRALKIPCRVGRWDEAEQAAAVKAMGVEMAAREARHRFLGATARDAGAARIALAHHADDQVELLFVRLLRGAGSRGLSGMRTLTRHGAPLNAWLARPLLGFRRAELSAWVRTQRIAFREDASNHDARFLRNRVRAELLPFLRDRFTPALDGTVLRTMTTLADEADWLRAAAGEFLAAKSEHGFAQLHPALQRQVLVCQLEQRGLAFDTELVEHLRREAGRPITATGGQVITRTAKGRVVVAPPRQPTPETNKSATEVSGPRGRVQFGGVAIQWSRHPFRKRPKFQSGRELFDADKIGDGITLRHWRPGDRFQPSGQGRAAKLQNLFTNAKIPRARRHEAVLALTGRGEIFWVEGLRISEQFKLTRATQNCLDWRWRTTPSPRTENC